jgi:uncharacterized membrane protein YgcG
MRRTALRLILAVATLIAVFFPALSSGSGEATPASDPSQITNYRAVFDVARSGTLKAVETLTTDMPSGRHGIFRYWDVSDLSDSHVRLVPKDIKITMDGSPVHSALSWEAGHSIRVAKIGDPDHYVTPGQHVYRISYRIDGAIAPPSAGADKGTADAAKSVFYWNVVPQGWEMSIARSAITVNLPAASEKVQCTSGDGGRCDVSGAGTRSVAVRTGALAPRTPVTVRVGLPLDPPDRVTQPWPVKYDGVFGRSLPIAIVLGLLALAGLVIGWLWERRTREEAPGLPVMYEPPAGIGPVQAAYIADEDMPGNALVGTLLYQAQQKLTKLTRTEDDAWVVEGLASEDEWSRTDPVTRAVGKELGVVQQGGVFAADGSAASGKQLQLVQPTIIGVTRQWATSAGFMRNVPAEAVVKLLVGAAVILAVVLFFFNPFEVTFAGLPFAGFAIGGVPVFRPGVGTRRTSTGRELWSRSGGFRRLLSTPSSQERFDFSGRKEIYTAYIPWAVTFDCADAWAEKYQTSVNEPPPSPTWLYGAYAGAAIGSSVNSVVDSFQSSLSSSIGAYQATQQSSSSGGGGGFSGGGGGGGGGGGSW